MSDAWAATTTADGQLLLAMLAGLAPFERELIRQRTFDGLARAKAQGVKLERPCAN
ncbi:MAG: recombinase family protein [Casimicrobiaceae bacterium]|nr:recombinase family protein [Casimicrobiaceae bacterium]